MYYIHSTFMGLALFFLHPAVDCMMGHIAYSLPPLRNIFIYMWFGFAYAFWVQYWFEKKMKNREPKENNS